LLSQYTLAYTVGMDRIHVRKVGGSLYIRFPFTYKHKFNLKHGDYYDMIPNGDGSIIRLVKVDELEKVVPRQEASVAAE
jgi:antitoxin component of MazEF toxin-antitoxin module